MLIFKKNIKNYKIKKLDISEYDKCNNIYDMAKFPYTEKFRKEIERGNRVMYVYEVKGKFFGEISIVFDMNDPDYTVPNERIYISRLIVKKEYRGMGIGGILVDYIVDVAREMGYKEMSIGVNKDNEKALNLYRKKGFTKVVFDGADEDGEYYKLVKIIDGINFDLLKKNDCTDLLNKLFDILYKNMNLIAPTGESYADDKEMWIETIVEALKNPKREIIVINSGDEIAGFFMYSVSNDLLKMEEIQFKSQYQRTGLFKELFKYLFTLVPRNVKQVEAFANKKNIKSQEILTYLELQLVGENKNGNSFRYLGEYEDMKKVITSKRTEE